MRFFRQERCSLCQETSPFLHKIRIGAGRARIKGRICSNCLVELMAVHLAGGKGLFIESNNPQAFDFVPFAALEAGRYTEHKIDAIKQVIGSDCACCEREATHFWLPRRLVQKKGNRLKLSTEVEEYGEIRGYCSEHMPVFFREYLKRHRSLLKRLCLPQRSESGVFY